MQNRAKAVSRATRVLAAAAGIAISFPAGAPAAFADDLADAAVEPQGTALDDAAAVIIAEDAARPFPMPGEIVVSAERGVPLRYPGGRDVLEKETLQQYPSASVSDAIRRVPGVYVIPENGNDGKVNIGLRGNDPRRSGLTTLLVDGIPIAEAPYGSPDIDALPISMERVNRIDVIRGGASVRYGPNSAGGVINFITDPIPERQTVRFGGRYGSDGDFSTWTSVGGTWDRFGMLGTVVRKGGDGFRDNSDYRIDDMSLKARYAFTDADTLNVSISHYFEPRSEQPGGLTQAAYDDDPDQSLRDGAHFREQVDMYTADYVHDFGPRSALEVIAWYRGGFRGLYDYRPIVAPYEVNRVQNSTFRTAAIEGRYSWETKIAGVRNAFYHSARYLHEGNYQYYYKSPLGGDPVQPADLRADFDTGALALFTEDVISLRDDLDLALGARHERLDMESSSRDTDVKREQKYYETMPEGSLTWSFLPRAAVYVSYLESFAPPQYETGFDPTSNFFRYVKPEHSDTWEVGTRIREIDGVEFSGAYFDTEYQDKIEFVNQPNGQKLAYNSAKTTSRGVELGASVDIGHFMPEFKGLSVYGSLTSMKSTIEAGEFDGNDSPGSPHTLASWGVEWKDPCGVWAHVGGTYSGSAYKEKENYDVGSADGVSGPLPSYTLWDAAVGWRENADGTGLALSMGVTNLLDEDYYRRFVSGIYPGAPRQGFVSASYDPVVTR